MRLVTISFFGIVLGEVATVPGVTRALKARRGGIPDPLGAVITEKAIGKYDIAGPIPGFSPGVGAMILVAPPPPVPVEMRDTDDPTEDEIATLKLAAKVDITNVETLAATAPAFVVAVLPHRLRDIGESVSSTNLSHTYELAGSALWMECLLQSSGDADRCNALDEFFARSALAKALVIQMGGVSLEQIWKYLTRVFSSPDEVMSDTFPSFRALPLSVVHALIVAAGPRGVLQAVMDFSLSSTPIKGTNTFFPFLTDEQEAELYAFIPIGDARWEDLPMCRYLTALLAPSPDTVADMLAIGDLVLADEPVAGRAWEAVTAKVDTITANDGLEAFLAHGPFAMGVWAKRSLCPFPQRIALLKSLEPGKTSISEAQVESVCGRGRSNMSMMISAMIAEHHPQPITAGLLRVTRR